MNFGVVKMSIRFSIIVPVYNVKEYLPRCLDSILIQSNKNYEILLIDDVSTDSTEFICENYAKEFKSIRLLHQRNLGVSCARNLGLEYSSGEYLLFIDSDDVILSSNYLDLIEESIIKSNFSIDCVAFEFTEFSEIQKLKGLYVNSITLPKYKSVVDGAKFLQDALKRNNRFPWRVWMYAFKKSLWVDNGFKFPEGQCYEDTRILWKVLLSATNVNVINQVLYGYRKGRVGAITKTNNFKQLTDKFDIESLNIEEIYNDKCIDKKLKKLLCDNFAFGYYAILFHSDSVDDVNSLIRILKKNKYYKYTYRFPQIFLKFFINLFGIDFVRQMLHQLHH